MLYSFLSPSDLQEVYASDNYENLMVAARYDVKTEHVFIMLGNFTVFSIPAILFTPTDNGLRPDFTKIQVIDCGLSLQLGEYEACIDAIMDRSYII